MLLKTDTQGSQESFIVELVPWIDLDKLSVVSETLSPLEETCRLDFLKSSQLSEAAEGRRSKKSVVEWLSSHQLTVTEEAEGVISIQGGLVKVRPPYRVDDCQSSNLIVLDRITSILALMPADEA